MTSCHGLSSTRLWLLFSDIVLLAALLTLSAGCRHGSQTGRWTGTLEKDILYTSDRTPENARKVEVLRFRVSDGTPLAGHYSSLRRMGLSPVVVDQKGRAVPYRPEFDSLELTVNAKMVDAGRLHAPEGAASLVSTPGWESGGGWTIQVNERNLPKARDP